ncbi:MAG: hypothetical protein IKW74_00455, partial [Thermoguttaceae bacterium]|nr:hypothetical protein [Thermoguttaceae bacterium]
RVAGDNQDALIDSPAYQAVISRCMTGRSQNEKPQIHFFIRPLEAGEAIRSLSNLTPQQKAKTSPFSILAKQGFDGIQGVGGTIDLASQGCESIYRVKVYVPEPAQQALKMFAVSNVKQILPPAWMGDNVLRCTLFNINILTVFNNIGPLFDEIYETEGAWNEILEQLEQDKRGPQVNLRTELIANFGSELVSMTAFDPDKPEEGEKFIFSLNIKPGKNQEVIDVLHRMFDTDPAFKVIQIGNEPAWQYSQSAPEKSRRTTSRNRSANVSTPAPVAGSGNELEIIKGGVFCVSDNYLMISNDLGFLTQTIQNMKSGTTQSIVNDPFYQKINNIIANDTSQNGLFVQGYIHNVDGVQVNYDLIRQNKLMDGRTLSARLWKLIFTAPDQVTGEKPIDIDGSKLPPFEKIQDKIGIGGFYGWVEQDGWYYQGFSVRKDNDPMSPGNRK